MTIHREVFDNGKERMPTLHRIYVEFEGGYFVTSLDSQFNSHLQEMVSEMGRPVKVEFRSTDEGWYEDDMGDNGDEGGTGDHG